MTVHNIQSARKSLQMIFLKLPKVTKSAGFAIVPTAQKGFELLHSDDGWVDLE